MLLSYVTFKYIPTFGSKRGVVTESLGSILIKNNQEYLPHISILSLRRTLFAIRRILSYPTYDVILCLVDDDSMRKMNRDTRGIDKSTDVLALPFGGTFIKPGILQEPDFDIPEYLSLGELMVSVPFVIRKCEEDRQISKISIINDTEKNIECKKNQKQMDRGVSKAMCKVYDPIERIHMLLVHGMLHLVGYNHDSIKDYKIMVDKEEEFMKYWTYLRKIIYAYDTYTEL